MLFLALKQYTNPPCLEKAFIYVLENNLFRMKERKKYKLSNNYIILLEDLLQLPSVLTGVLGTMKVWNTIPHIRDIKYSSHHPLAIT